ncbi:GntR family transcriptional regulator [Cypionkella sinensis]|uniref:GntR family transcriptional regulator n=1 Tax=Cypionkella sinensis TaxID=1756043 RepID=A0ABV7IYV9_9RHOB
MSAGRMTEDARKIPTHEVTYARLRDMILFGVLEPGQPVTIQGLTAGLEAGMTPVREAIRRLAAEGALLPQGNRRVTVPRLSATDLDQVAFARLTIEPHLAGLAVITPALIAKLEALDAAVDAAIRADDVSGYLKSNHAFHFALYEAAGAGVLLDMARSLWLRFGPSLRVVSSRSGATSLPDSHKEALAAMRAGDAVGLSAAMQRDIAQGVDQVRAALQRGEI